MAASEWGAVRPTTHLPTITPTLTTDAASLPTAAVSADNTSIASTKGCCCCCCGDCRRSAGSGSVGVGRGRAVRVGPAPATALQPNGAAGGARGHVHNVQLHRVVQGEEGGGRRGGRHACHCTTTTATNTATTSTRGHGHGHRGLTGGQGPATHRQQGRGGRQEQQTTAAAISTAAPQSQHAAAHT